MIIEESGMRFGEYPDNMVFYIEKSPQYQIHLMSNGIKTCEFILLKDLALWFRSFYKELHADRETGC